MSASDTPLIADLLVSLQGMNDASKVFNLSIELEKTTKELVAAKDILKTAKAEVEEIRQKLKDPHAVRVNLLYGHIAKPDDLIFMHDQNGPYNILLKSRDAWKKMAGELYQAAKKIPPYPSPAHQLQTPNWWDLNAATIDYEKLLKEDGG